MKCFPKYFILKGRYADSTFFLVYICIECIPECGTYTLSTFSSLPGKAHCWAFPDLCSYDFMSSFAKVEARMSESATSHVH